MSDEETELDDAATSKALAAFVAVAEDAKKKGFKAGHGGNSNCACPVCADGTIRYSVASVNGHIWASCSTDGCVRWMQ